MDSKYNIQKIRQNLPGHCTLIAVSKTQSPEIILRAYDAGQKDFGENKVQELVQKYETLPKDIQWHMIGHLQTNKVKFIAPFVHLVHSVDSAKLLNEINKQGQKLGRTIQCLLQIHIAIEKTKFGFSEDELLHLLHEGVFENLSNIQIVGLMGMATLTNKSEEVRKEFRNLKKFFDRIKTISLPTNIRMQELSMGMSGDYQIAVEEGSTMVRIGSAIFGERKH